MQSNNDRKGNVDRSHKLTTTLILLLGVGVVVATLVTNSRKLSLSSQSQPDKKIGVTQEIPQPLPTFEDFGLTIEKLRISTPIIPAVDGTNEDIYYPALAKGVAQFKGSSNPDVAGNLFVFGGVMSNLGCWC